MPRTKLDKYSLSKQEKEARIIKACMADRGIFTNKALAEAIKSEPGYISKGFKKGFSDAMKLRIIYALNMDIKEREALMGW